MTRRVAIIIWACFATVAGHAQQLVPNPSFEGVTSCPTFASMLNNAAPWFNPTGGGTPELYHACAGSGTFAGVPANISGGFQLPRTGQGFAGVYTYRTDNPGFREFIEVPLLSPLIAGQCYRLSFYVNVPDDFELACDGIGAHFSVGPAVDAGMTIMNVEPHIEHPLGNVFTDSVGWTEVSGIYTAAGGEDHLVIGNFRTDDEMTVVMFNPGTWYQQQAYLLIDDVSLVPYEEVLDLGPDTLICGGEGYTVDASMPDATATLWSDGNTDPVRTITDPGTYSVTVSVGGCTFQDEVVIGLVPLPLLELGDDRILCKGLSLELIATVDAASQLVWDDGSTAISRVVSEAGFFHATATNECGSVTDTVTIEVEECPEEIFIPNAFTPNSDGINDAFRPVYDERIWALKYSIFDRLGGELFRSVEGREWNPENVPAGVYVVKAEAISKVDRKHQALIGHLVVIR